MVDLEPSPQAFALEHLDSSRVLQPSREISIVGRRAGCDIVVSDADVSRAHALILAHNDRPAILDLLSSNGTFVNNERVAFHILENDDVLKIGESSFRVRLVGSGISEKSAKKIKSATKPVLTIATEEHHVDLIDIHKTESVERWRIADDAERVPKVARRA